MIHGLRFQLLRLTTPLIQTSGGNWLKSIGLLTLPAANREDEMQLSDAGKRRVTICERMRGIESELFALSERLVEPDFEGGHLIERLYAERTQLAIELLRTRSAQETRPSAGKQEIEGRLANNRVSLK